MAQRDRSQGFGFVYVDIQKLLAQRHEFAERPEESLSTAQTMTVPSVNFNKDNVRPLKRPEIKSGRAEEVHQVKENLDRLQSLHHKLHAMLEELNQLTGKKKK